MPDETQSPRVAVAILVEDATRVPDTVLAARLQSLEPSEIVAVGGGGPAREAAEDVDIAWVASLDDLVLEDQVTHLWFLRDDVEARPDALAALVRDGDRVEASVAGSKVLDASDRDRLISIGGATDALCVPVPILEEEELDQGQYDVIRDVAYIPSQSILIRRDAFRGLGGLDRLMAPDAAGIDFAQRARISGGRVVIVPSSEVFTKGLFAAALPRWREQAGQLRAMLKSYGWVSLLWALPLWLVVSAVTAVGWTLLGHPGALLDLGKSVAWNLKNVPSLAVTRRRAGAARQVGDEELFRYQTSGSHALAVWWAALTSALRRPMESGADAIDRVEASGIGAGFASTIALLATWFLAVRVIITEGVPLGAWTGAFGVPADVLAGYAGGWNPASMGGDGPPHPSAALFAVAGLGFGSATITWAAALTVLAGMLGSVRLARTLGLGRWPGVVVAGVTALGPAVAAAGTDGGYQVLAAVAAVPWVVHYVLTPIRAGWRARLGQVARLALASAILGMAAPAALVIPVVVALVAVVLRGRWSPLVFAPIAVVAALPALGPWVLWYDSTTLGGPVPGFWEPAIWVVAAAGISWLATVVAGGRWQAAGVGGVLAGAGMVAARGIVPGREAWVAGVVAAALGLGLIAGGAVDRLLRPGRGRVLGVVASLGAAVLAVPIAGAFLNGTISLQTDEPVADLLGYLDARGSTTQERAVLDGVAHPGSGDDRRVLDPWHWTYDRAWLGPPGPLEGDLDTLLDGLRDAPIARPGAALADFGVRWVVTPAGSALEGSLSGRLDMYRLVTPDGVVFESVAPAPIAFGEAGPWALSSRLAEGPPSERVMAWINPTDRWDAVVADGGVVLAGGAGELGATPDAALLVVARVAAGLYGLVALVAVWGRRTTG
jgi:hypothetical protein